MNSNGAKHKLDVALRPKSRDNRSRKATSKSLKKSEADIKVRKLSTKP